MDIRLGLNILLAVGILATAAGGAALLFRDYGSSDGVTITMDESGATPSSAAPSAVAPATIKVYISGEALHPGVYELQADARADDALGAAGGPTSNAALERVNLAKRLSDEEHIHIPGWQEEAVGSQTIQDAPAPALSGKLNSEDSWKLNINTATVEEFTSLPNIGPSKAAAIADYRERMGPFESVDDLKNVSGIGDKITDSIRDLVEVR